MDYNWFVCFFLESLDVYANEVQVIDKLVKAKEHSLSHKPVWHILTISKYIRKLITFFFISNVYGQGQTWNYANFKRKCPLARGQKSSKDMNTFVFFK